jgi:NAD(P)-dependent dehydrogenase (short-subunit alcohol dehydrogenase family)
MYTVPDQTGKRFVITGANAGTGKEAARRIAAAGGAVIMAVRTPSKGQAAKAEMLADPQGAALEVRQLDLADRSRARAFAESLLADAGKIQAGAKLDANCVPNSLQITPAIAGQGVSWCQTS